LDCARATKEPEMAPVTASENCRRFMVANVVLLSRDPTYHVPMFYLLKQLITQK
jgi:hypothetical protein